MSRPDPVAHALARPSRTAVPRLALSKREAAESIGCSIDFLEEHVMPELRVVRRGRKVLIPVKSLEQWLDHEAALTIKADL